LIVVGSESLDSVLNEDSVVLILSVNQSKQKIFVVSAGLSLDPVFECFSVFSYENGSDGLKLVSSLGGDSVAQNSIVCSESLHGVVDLLGIGLSVVRGDGVDRLADVIRSEGSALS